MGFTLSDLICFDYISSSISYFMSSSAVKEAHQIKYLKCGTQTPATANKDAKLINTIDIIKRTTIRYE